MTQNVGNGNRCMELHRQIYEIHNNIVGFYEKTEQSLDQQDGKPIGIPIEHEFLYALQYYLGANQRTLKIVSDGKEEKLLLQTHRQLLILQLSMIRFVEERFSAAFYAMLSKYPHEAIDRHLNIKQFHEDSFAIKEILGRNKHDQHQLYAIMAEAGDTAEKMVKNFAMLKKTEGQIAIDATKSRRLQVFSLVGTITVTLAGVLITFILN